MTIQEYLNTEPLTNRKQLIGALFDKYGHREGTFDMLVAHVGCPYIGMDPAGHCEGLDYDNITDGLCFECKEEWLDKEI